MKRVGSKSRTSPPIRAECSEASKRVIRSIPGRASRRLAQTCSGSEPMGVMKPIPVIATRFLCGRSIPKRYWDGELPCLLGHPGSRGVGGAASQVATTTADLDEEQNV